MKFRAICGKIEKDIAFREGMSILDALRCCPEIPFSAPCGGNGKCGKCTVVLIHGGKRETVRSCRTPALDGSIVHVDPLDENTAVSENGMTDIPASSGAGGFASLSDGSHSYGIACDIGTTTVVCRLIDINTGEALASSGRANIQRSFGSDVISRIASAGSGHLDELCSMIRTQISDMILQLCDQAAVSVSDVKALSAAGNPTMCHFFAGLDPEGIGKYPFVCASLFGDVLSAEELELPFRGEVYILPSVSAYIGGDITGDMTAVSMDRCKKPVLLVDVGTNAEMVIGCQGRFICCSAAAGPAFEGAEISCGMTASDGAINRVEYTGKEIKCSVLGNKKAAGICGSGLIDAAAVMLDLGAVDETGRMMNIEEDADSISDAVRPYLFITETGESAFRLTEDVFITQSDIRRLQLGKAAILAGIRILTKTYGVEYSRIDSIFLAGGFGSFIRPKSAARAGLIPKELLPAAKAAGNAAVEGAAAALTDPEVRKRLSKLVSSMEYHELAADTAFADAYIEEMTFPATGTDGSA